MNLYQLTGELLKAQQLLEETDDIEALELSLFLDSERNKKLEAYLYLIKNFAALAEARSEEAKKLKELAEWADKRVEKLKVGVMNALLPGEKFNCPIGGFSWRASTACVSENMEVAPEDYIEMRPKVLVSKIKEDLKHGVDVEGWSLVQKQNLQIK